MSDASIYDDNDVDGYMPIRPFPIRPSRPIRPSLPIRPARFVFPDSYHPIRVWGFMIKTFITA